MYDLPTGPALLALARDVLLNDLLPLLPPETRLDARLVANGIAIAEREALAGNEPAEAILHKLERFYRDSPHPSPPQSGGGRDPRSGRVGAEPMGILHRFAQDLRVEAFEASEPLRREAREILWQLTIAKLRCANPRFLHANGFS